ncbi:hypothetical protein COOONC_10917 [Cooperia oncophora]
MVQEKNTFLHRGAHHSNCADGFSQYGSVLPTNRFWREDDTHNFRVALYSCVSATGLKNSSTNFQHYSTHGKVSISLLTFVLNVITILVTVIIINVYFRGPTTHRMPKWVRKLFLEWMPHAMCMQRPKSQVRKPTPEPTEPEITQLPGLGHFTINPAAHHPFCPSADEK